MSLICFQMIWKGSLQTAMRHKLIKVWSSSSEWPAHHISNLFLRPLHEIKQTRAFKSCTFADLTRSATRPPLPDRTPSNTLTNCHYRAMANCSEVRSFQWGCCYVTRRALASCPGWRDNFLGAQTDSLNVSHLPPNAWSLARGLGWGREWLIDISSYQTDKI